MGPKVEAALSFLAGGGEYAAITSPGLVATTLSGEGWAGTRIERSPARVGQGR
jgi:carbamate kinase